MPSLTTLIFLILGVVVHSLGPLPDASQEGILWPWKGYASVALFHYNVPDEATRATWEFASFQDNPDCPSRQVHVWIQHGSYPVVNASSTTEFPIRDYYVERSYIEWLTLDSAYKPTDTLVHPVYNPLPGSWFVAAYLEPANGNTGFLRTKCRYSLGSIALWNRADNVELIQANDRGLQTFITTRHFSYYKFYVPEDVNRFVLSLKNCRVLLKKPRQNLNNETCIEYIGIRASALPLHRPTEFQQEWRNLSANSTAKFVENRPHEGVYYYLLVVSNGRVGFEANLKIHHCGDSGIYGPGQKDWYLNERGLVWEDERTRSDDGPGSNFNTKAGMTKEPKTGFQLFSSRAQSQTEIQKENIIFETTDLVLSKEQDQNDNETSDAASVQEQHCVSKFDFTRIEGVRAFTVNYMVQGRSWYTKWLTVLEQFPIYTRFKTFDYTDLGGSLNIRVTMDVGTFTDPNSHLEKGFYHIITGCLSKGRQPRLVVQSSDGTSKMSCDNHGATIKVADLDSSIGTEALKIIPFPEPGLWYIGFQLDCRNTTTGDLISCPESSVSAMVSVDVNIQPCDYRPLQTACGGNGHGLCSVNNKGSYSFSSCSCAPGYRGWNCDLVDPNVRHSQANTLLLTLSNLCFLPAIILAFHRRLYGQGIVYLSTMSFSLFYHLCDQEAFSGMLPEGLQKTCLVLYVNNEVLQFCDFFSALLSFWITCVALSAFPSENAFNLFGSLLLAFLVQYNRTGSLVLLIPVPLGLSILVLSCIVRGLKKKRCIVIPSRRSVAIFLPAILCLLMACSLATVASTDKNYPYVHSGWHALISIALSFLVLKCPAPKRSQSVVALSEENDSSSSACTRSHCATTTISRINDDSVADVVSQAPSLNTSERSTTYLQMPSMQNISNNHASQNGGIQNNHVTSSKMTLINKSLSYMQNFRTLLSRQD